MRNSLAAALAALAAAGLSQAASAKDLDRAGIIDVTNAYIAALVAHDPSKAPLSDKIKLVENVTKTPVGEGLWKTATAGPTDFKIYVPDTVKQQAGFLGVIEREGKPTLLALRLKLEDGKIVEAEHLVQAAVSTNPQFADRSLAQLKTPRPGLLAEIPEGQRLSEEKLVAIGVTYYDALDDNDGSKMPFAPDCERHENGITTASGTPLPPPPAGAEPPAQAPVARDCKGQMDSQSFVYIEHIDDRRMVGADPVTGLAMGLSHFRHSMTNLPYKVIHVDGSTSERNKQNLSNGPFDMPAAHIFKIGADGLVHEIEAVGVTGIPFNSPTGWE